MSKQLCPGLDAHERETVVNASDGDGLVRIWTAQRRYITRLRRDAAFTEIATGFHGRTAWVEFTIPAERWSPVGVKRQRHLSDATRARCAERGRTLARLRGSS